MDETAVPTTSTCAHCGRDAPPDAQFCAACGASLAPVEPPREERKLVSILFVDLEGFTASADEADPEDVRDALSRYHAAAKEQIEAYGGVVEKFIGDAVMAVFGAPLTQSDDAERAVRAGFRVLAAVDELNERGLALSARAAVNTGEAVVSVSRRDAGEALAIGDVVNTAARLQSSAPAGPPGRRGRDPPRDTPCRRVRAPARRDGEGEGVAGGRLAGDRHAAPSRRSVPNCMPPSSAARASST